ncbi:hypothetical protein X759_08405 [Mesorhizobium sp. LSHC420B00]|nr:hypothetical protein X759_08405 [Mesorhizobium sp. LSHC420B00]
MVRFVIVISGWARLGIGAVDCVFDQNKKPPARPRASVHPGSRVDLSGSFACSARHWTRIP